MYFLGVKLSTTIGVWRFATVGVRRFVASSHWGGVVVAAHALRGVDTQLTHAAQTTHALSF